MAVYNFLIAEVFFQVFLDLSQLLNVRMVIVYDGGSFADRIGLWGQYR